ncbi:MAG TPA: phage tail protein [Allosphingosinicella sp.]|jgi:hypothetical protein
MLKPDLLRAALVAAVPELARDPDKLTLFVEKGRIAARAGPANGFEYRYQLQAVLLDFTGHPDAVMIAVLNWIHDHQPELLLNHSAGNEAISFDADIIDADTIDLAFTLELNEAVTFTPRAGGGFDATHRGEPQLVDALLGIPATTLLGEIYLGGELIVQAG